MRHVRVLLALAPLLSVELALYAPACSGGRPASGSASDSGLSADATVDSALGHSRVPYAGLPRPGAGPRVAVHAEFVSTPIRTDTMQLMFAAGEMQTGGEPFASSFAGRDLVYFVYSRYAPHPDQYYAPCSSCGATLVNSLTDLFGFSTTVESYEYSKYHTNMVANQSGAGVSLINGPLIATQPGATPIDRLRNRMGILIAATGADVAQYAKLPPPSNDPLNDFGFPGLWPNMDPYRSFDTTMAPDKTVVNSCTTVTGYGGVKQYGGQAVFRYECDYNSLRLANRNQAERVIGPGVLGYSTWKEALWAIDFVSRLHDGGANFVTAVAPQDVPRVGQRRNSVQAIAPPKAAAGVYVGSTPLEGMWGLTMIDEMDNAAAWLLSSLATTDGVTLGGLPSLLAAIQYDYGSPLVWFPSAIAVTEATAGADGGSVGNGAADRYPLVTGLRIEDATSRSVDLAALAQGYALFFGMTDERNAAVGQQIGMKIAFGGSVFAADNGLPDGENTPHDRALAVMRVAFVDLDRMHADPATGVVVDSATVRGGAIARDPRVTTTALGHVVVGLRHLLMACNAAVTQYGAPDSDRSKDGIGILNAASIAPPDVIDGGTLPSFSGRVRQVLLRQAEFVRDTLTSADGTVRNGATLVNAQWAVSTESTTLEAQSAALRVLVEAWFLTHDTSEGIAYRDRARAVARSLFTEFWSQSALMFRGQARGADDVVMTPERFGWLQQALRETYKTVSLPGDPLLDRSVLESHIARVNKLYLNGWDDLNGDQQVQKPAECLGARLQLGEQALTGEIGTNNQGYPKPDNPPDRESDCVPNISYANAGSVLAGEVHFHAP